MSIEAMKQAIEALETTSSYATAGWVEKAHREAITSLRQAIADFEKQEPVAWMDKSGITHKHKHFEDMTPLYTHPQPKREPLTDEYHDLLALCRAIEAAHGIKENT
jgi:hypothetical protein